MQPNKKDVIPPKIPQGVAAGFDPYVEDNNNNLPEAVPTIIGGQPLKTPPPVVPKPNFPLYPPAADFQHQQPSHQPQQPQQQQQQQFGQFPTQQFMQQLWAMNAANQFGGQYPMPPGGFNFMGYPPGSFPQQPAFNPNAPQMGGGGVSRFASPLLAGTPHIQAHPLSLSPAAASPGAAQKQDSGTPRTPKDLEEMEQAVPLKVEREVEELDFYHGLLPREDIECLLKCEGDYLLRQSETKDKERGKNVRFICLSILAKEGMSHFQLKKNPNDKYSSLVDAEKLEFSTCMDLVSHYANKKDVTVFRGKPLLFVTPVKRKEWELRHHEIESKTRLGAGAFGEVYAGELRRKKKKMVKVAIKMLKTVKVDKAKIQELMHEARVMRALKHRNVVRCYGIAADAEPLMILMELINGGALDVYLKHTKGIKITTVLLMAYDAACGLEYIHSKNILHRDVAARNCLYDSKVTKISDFGLSVVGESYTINPHEKAPVKWLAPEGFKTGIYTKASDVWAYGVLLWELFNDGGDPYQGWTGAQIRELVCTRGSQLEFKDGTGPQVLGIAAEVFNTDPLLRITMADVVKKIKRIPFLPQPQGNHEEQDSEDSVKQKKNKTSLQMASNQKNLKKLNHTKEKNDTDPECSERKKHKDSAEKTKLKGHSKGIRGGSREPMTNPQMPPPKTRKSAPPTTRPGKSNEGDEDDSKRLKKKMAGSFKNKKLMSREVPPSAFETNNNRERLEKERERAAERVERERERQEREQLQRQPARDKFKDQGSGKVQKRGSREEMTNTNKKKKRESRVTRLDRNKQKDTDRSSSNSVETAPPPPCVTAMGKQGGSLEAVNKKKLPKAFQKYK